MEILRILADEKSSFFAELTFKKQSGSLMRRHTQRDYIALPVGYELKLNTVHNAFVTIGIVFNRIFWRYIVHFYQYTVLN